jgi:PKD repeat protein
VAAVDSPDVSITGVPETVAPGESITLNGTESEAGYGDIVEYEWKINGQTLSGESVTTSIDEPGRYTVELVVTNDIGDSATTQTTLVVESQSETTVSPTDSDSESSSTATGTDVDTKTTETTGPGLGISVALVAITLFVVIRGRRDR